MQFAAGLILFMVACPLAAQQAGSKRVDIERNGAKPSTKGPAEYFTGDVWVERPFAQRAPARVSGATVTFAPGARTAWHTHPLGQTLIVTAGRGWVQRDGAPVEAIEPGDIVLIPAGERHWHGATRTTSMTHIAIAEARDGKVVAWQEQVSDADYTGPAK